MPAKSLFLPDIHAASAAPIVFAPSMPTASPDELDDEIAELNAYFNTMLAEGAFNKPAATDTRFDLTGDGVNDAIFVDPGDFLAADGRIVVTDGVSQLPRFELNSPPNELCFGEHVALVPDCDIDGNSELVVASGRQVGDEVHLRIRVFSGASGELLGIITWQNATQTHGEPTSTIHVAGDVNFDQLIDTADITTTVAALGSETNTEQADLDVDGAVTMVDVVKVASKAIDESVAPRAAMLRANLAGIEAVADLLPFPPFITGEPVNSWDCWVNAALLALEFGALLAAITACSASTVTGPAAIACWIGAACLAALFRANLSVHLRDCFVPPQSNMRGEVDSFHTKLLLLCAATGAAGVAWKEI